MAPGDHGHTLRILSSHSYPLFTSSELTSRRSALEAAAEAAGVRTVVAYGGPGSTAVPWLTGWQVTREAAVVITPGEPLMMLVQFYNHVPNATEIAMGVDVRWAGPDLFATLTELLVQPGPGRDGVGTIGALPYHRSRTMIEHVGGVVDLSFAYERIRTIKSSEELEWMRHGAQLTDLSLDAFLGATRPGTSETELLAAVEASYLSRGGTNHIHYLATTSMTQPAKYVPAQYPSNRTLREGDVLITELSASFWGYPGQLLRTVTLGAEPTPLYRELHDVAEAARSAICSRVVAGVHAQELFEAARLIGEAGFTIYDDLVHGFGGGYLPPVIGTDTRQNEPTPDVTLQAGMTIVVQPNVVTKDHSAGVQTGELILVTDDGFELMHSAPRGLLQR